MYKRQSVYVLIFHYLPILGTIIGFKDYTSYQGIFGSPWTGNFGFKHFINFVKLPNFWTIVGNTLELSVYSIVLNTVLPVILALFINEIRWNWAKKSVQIISYAPYFISTVVLVGMLFSFSDLESGVFNLSLIHICKTYDCTCNEVGIALAKNPEGPYIKADELNPIAEFYTSADYDKSSWGYGQPCVISSDNAGKILLFYTKGVKSGTYVYVEEWDLSDISKAKLVREGRLYDKGVVNASGQTDCINNADFAYDPFLKRLYCLKEDFPYPCLLYTSCSPRTRTYKF